MTLNPRRSRQALQSLDPAAANGCVLCERRCGKHNHGRHACSHAIHAREVTYRSDRSQRVGGKPITRIFFVSHFAPHVRPDGVQVGHSVAESGTNIPVAQKNCDTARAQIVLI